MIAWQYGSDLADFATLGGASKHVNAYDLAHLARYAQIGVVMDADAAGDKARERWSQMEGMENRLTVIQPPDHDLTDYWRNGGNLRKWLAGEAGKLLRKAVEGAGEDAPVGWQKSLEWAEMEAMGPSF
jgi:hypothetical protein